MGKDTIVYLFILSYISPVPACNGVDEIILQPYMGRKISYPDNYPTNTGYEATKNCSWKVTAAQGYEVVVYPRWECYSDVTISLYYGATTLAQKDRCVACPSSNGYCIDIIQTRSSEVLLSLLTNSSHSGGGFHFRFMAVERNRARTCVSSGTRLLAEKTPKFIMSPEFSSSYDSNLNCLWTVEPAVIEKDTRLVFEFRSQYLEMGFDGCADFVRIDGLIDFCEQTEDSILQTSSPMPLNSTTVNVRFLSDYGYAGNGFVLAFFVEKVGGAPQTSEAILMSSKYSSSKATSTFSQDLSSVISTRSTSESTTSIMDIGIQTSTHLHETSRASPSHETNSPHDLSTSINTPVSPVHSCNGVDEIILQPYMGREVAYPDNYPNENCSWKVTAAQGYDIVVYPRWECNSYVTISLYYGATSSAQKDSCVACPNDNGYCIDIIQTRSSEVLLSLVTNSSHSDGGFQFRFMAVERNIASTCMSNGTRLFADKTPKFIMSPRFPSNYYSNLNCLWTVEPAVTEKDTRLVFEFRSQYLEMGFDGCSDFVRIDGLNDFCEQANDNILQTSSPLPLDGTTAKVRFISDYGYAGNGFVLAFYVEKVGGAPQTSEAVPMSSKSSYSMATTAISQDSRSTSERTSSTVDIGIQTITHLREASRASPSHETNSPHDLSTSTNIPVLPRFLLQMVPQDDFSLKCKEDINLRCTVKYPEVLINLIGGSFIWQKNGKKILPDSGYNVTLGKMFTTLRKPSAVLDDSGIYSCSHSASPESVHVSIYVNITNSGNTCTGGKKEKFKPKWIKDAISNYLKDKIKLDRTIKTKIEEEKLNIEKRKQKLEMEMFRIEKEESTELLKLLTLLIKDQKDN